MPFADPGLPEPGNRLLAALGRDEFLEVRRHMRYIRLHLGEVLEQPGDPVERVIFPDSGSVSIFSTLSDGRSVELAMVGTEGVVGVETMLGMDAIWAASVQLPGEGLSLNSRMFRQLLQEHPRLQRAMLAYQGAFITQIGLTATCNRFHAVSQRLARWMLMSRDRAAADEFPLTHEFLSRMLGVRRATITMALRQLQEHGSIRYRRGNVTVLDRLILESESCECYGASLRALDSMDRVLADV